MEAPFSIREIAESKIKSCNPQRLAHAVNAVFFLVEIGMNIQVECRCYIRVAKYDADGFVIASAFNAPGCECVTKSMKGQMRNIQPFQQPAEIITIRAGFFGLQGSSYHVRGAGLFPYCFQGLKKRF